MIIGVGIDIVCIKRFRRAINKWGLRFLEKIFSEVEIHYCESRGENRFQSYAGLFSAKEAFVKAFGTGFREMEWKEIRITRDKLGKPVIQLSDRLLERAKSRNMNYFYLSISHTRENAIAQVLIES